MTQTRTYTVTGMSKGTRTFIRHFVEMLIAMVPAMPAAMLLRRDEYTRHHHLAGEVAA
jgi:hypothetical protein